MAKPIDSIVFEERGYSHVLSGLVDFANAIESGQITVDSMVKVYRADGTYRSRRAGDVPVLKRIFSGEDVLAPPPPPTEIPSTPEVLPPTEASPPQAPPASAAEPVSLTSLPPPESPAPSQPLGAAAFARWWPAFAMLVFALFAMAYFKRGGETGGQSNITNEMVEVQVPYDIIGSSTPTRYYMSRTTNIRSQPTQLSSQAPAPLVRGDQIVGVKVRTQPGHEYIKLSEGTYAGWFVWASNIRSDAPPPLEARRERKQPLVVAATVYASPQEGAAPLYDLAAGEEAIIVGLVAGDWFEAYRRENGGVGYIKASAFTRQWFVRNRGDKAILLWVLPDKVDEGSGTAVDSFTIPGGSYLALADPNGRPIMSREPRYNLYAKTIEEGCVWPAPDSESSSVHEVGARSLPMQAYIMELEGDVYVLNIGC